VTNSGARGGPGPGAADERRPVAVTAGGGPVVAAQAAAGLPASPGPGARPGAGTELDRPVEKGLKGSAIGLLSSTIIGLAATAPAYSITATLGFVVLAVGLHAPAMMLLAFFPMMAVAVGYAQLNRADPDCGTIFTWATRNFGPRTGWLGGWVATLASVIAMAYLASIVGSYFFLLFGADGIAAQHSWTTLAGVLVVLIMTWVCYRGIQISARMQYVLFGIEAAMLVVFSLVALIKVGTGHGPSGSMHPSLQWFSPWGTGGVQPFTTGLLLALFIYWGWDSAVSVNEETSDRRRNPGRAAVLATLVLVGLYMLVTIAAQSYGGTGAKGLGLANPVTAPDVLANLGQSVLGTGLNKLLILATLSSAIGALQTGILPTARTTLAMATYRALPPSFARMAPRFATPSVSTLTIGGATAVLFAGLTFLSHGRIQSDSILSIGLLIAFYYGLVGYTCAWHFRRQLRSGARELWLKGIIPLFGSAVLTYAFIFSATQMWKPDYGFTSFHGIGGVFLLGMGTIILGAAVMVVYSVLRPAFFRAGRDLPEAPELAQA
jgi:amino acid transporter